MLCHMGTELASMHISNLKCQCSSLLALSFPIGKAHENLTIVLKYLLCDQGIFLAVNIE